MFGNTPAIENPYGICVFGSALLKAAPDSAVIHNAVTRIEQSATEAFSRAKEGARVVAEFLRRSNVDEFGTSRISLTSEFRFIGGEQRFQGYRATVGFTVRIAKLEALEQVLTGIVEAGANDIRSIQFQTSDLKNLRTQARSRAVEAAKEKAANYAQAASVDLGEIIHIQDLNPQTFQRQFHARGPEPEPVGDVDYEAPKQILDPGAIEVTAAVLVAFKLLSRR